MSLAATLTQSLRSKYPSGLDKNEVRPSMYGYKELFQADTEATTSILSQDTRENIKRSFGNSGGVDIPVLDKSAAINIGNVRSCTIADEENTSALVTLTFVTYVFGFTMTPAQHFNNDIKYQADFDRKLEERLIKLADTIDTQAYNTANTARNSYWPAAITNYYPVVGDALQVPNADKEDFYNQMQAIMAEMDYPAPYNVAHTTSHRPLVARLMNQGLGNAVNEQFQFDPGFNFFGSNRIPNGVGVESTALFSVPGSYAMENRNDPDCVLGRVIGDPSAPVKEWSEQFMPIVNMDMGVYYTADCSDDSLKGGGANTRNFKEGWEFSTDVTYVTVYNSDPANCFTPIVKAEILQ